MVNTVVDVANTIPFSAGTRITLTTEIYISVAEGRSESFKEHTGSQPPVKGETCLSGFSSQVLSLDGFLEEHWIYEGEGKAERGPASQAPTPLLCICEMK